MNKEKLVIRLGTRKSELALQQAKLVARALEAAGNCTAEIITLRTAGDEKQELKGAVERDKKDWVIAFEQALLAGSIDLAIHSAKDVPTDVEPQTMLIPVLKRANPFDALIVHEKSNTCGSGLNALSRGCTVGTSSLRRAAQIRRLRPDLAILEIRGNVPTRINKMEQGESSALVLAAAGLERLGLGSRAHSVFTAREILPAVTQGILIAQVMRANEELLMSLRHLVDLPTEFACRAERSCITTLGADCHSAVAAYSEIAGAKLVLKARVLGAGGEHCLEWQDEALPVEAEVLGDRVAKRLLSLGASELL